MYMVTCVTMGTDKRISVVMLDKIPERKPMKSTKKSLTCHGKHYIS